MVAEKAQLLGALRDAADERARLNSQVASLSEQLYAERMRSEAALRM